ncbi:hypothetical protein C0Q70_18026 [Pomacea canaliculata]|uniref:FAM20 C-terminal domain-containing protein n=1 Tax=Pomacea canaliculata TaxID=400727 RepID=A0A2T7NM26_POMCA|nr:hypothetical protein C0Q70_18026 [Pomacea canaliculata]
MDEESDSRNQGEQMKPNHELVATVGPSVHPSIRLLPNTPESLKHRCSRTRAYLPRLLKQRLRLPVIVVAAIVFLISVSDIVLRPDQSAPSAKDRTVDTIATDLVLDLKVERLVQKHRVDLNRSLTGPLSPWQIASAWVTAREIIPDFAPRLGAILGALARAKVTQASASTLGTQLEADLRVTASADGGLQANVDRDCFYGACQHCSAQSGVCTRDGLVEGAIILWLPPEVVLSKVQHPWMEGFKTAILKKYEESENSSHKTYCDVIRRLDVYRRHRFLLLDIMDTAVFDFLIGNNDRHHFEFTNDTDAGMLVMLDNGKRFATSPTLYHNNDNKRHHHYHSNQCHYHSLTHVIITASIRLVKDVHVEQPAAVAGRCSQSGLEGGVEVRPHPPGVDRQPFPGTGQTAEESVAGAGHMRADNWLGQCASR